jgi:two-component system NarL family sensor kinase
LRTKQDLLRYLIEVQEQEKQFLCHEFHDGLIQYAAGSLMSLEGFCAKRPAGEDLSQIEAAINNLRKGVEDGRRVIRGIRPAVLDDSGLEAAIEDLIGQFKSSGIMVTQKCDPKIGRLPDMIQTTVYRVVQEALNNARKHSGTDVVRIELSKANGDLHLEVQDFGCGFDVTALRKGGFGLPGMAERVKILGGDCQIQSEQDVGTRISVRLPIPSSS